MNRMKAVDELGEIVIQSIIDNGLFKCNSLLNGMSKAPNHESLQNDLKSFNDIQNDVVRRLVFELLSTAAHDFLFMIQESKRVKILVNKVDAIKLSDGLHGELFGKNGWIEKFSKETQTL